MKNLKTSYKEKNLIKKNRSLLPDKVEEVVDFISYKKQNQHLINAANKLSEDVFKKVWDNPDDNEYNKLLSM